MVIVLPDLYPHQEEIRDRIRASLQTHRRSILCAPPGTGKTRLAKWIMGSYASRPRQDGQSGFSLFAVHRRGLVDNASDSFEEVPQLPHGMIMNGHETDFKNSVHVGSIDTINSWYVKGEEYDGHTFDLIVFDECHAHLPALRSFLKVHDAKREKEGLLPAYVMGLSATPQHREMNEVFREIVIGKSPQWLIDNHFLSPFRYFQCTKGDLGKLVRHGDDYTESSVSDAMANLAGDLVKDWQRIASGRATVGFFPRRTHAQEAMGILNAAGIRTGYVDGDTKDDVRRDMFSDLNEGRLDYITNVGVIERGTDIPRVGCIQMCTAVGNVVRWKQMIGRGSRIHPDVEHCLVLDHADNIRRLGFFEDDVKWSLDWGERPAKTHETRQTIECPSCGAVYRGGQCRKCGYEPTKRERKAQGLEFIGGELQEVDRKDKKPTTVIKSNEQLFISALFAAGKSGKTYGAAYKIAQSYAAKQGTEFTMPAWFEVAGHRYKPVPFNNPDRKRQVKLIYGFTVDKVSREANPYREN
jgi:superfamily II DNA or RNA helicase